MWKEAQVQLVDVTERQRNLLQGRGEFHPDRLGGLVELGRVYNELGEFENCRRVAHGAVYALGRISTKEHSVARNLKNNLVDCENRIMERMTVGV